MNEVIITPMTSDDVSEVYDIERLSFETPWSEETLTYEVEKNLFSKYVVAKIDGVVVGYGGMWIIIDEAHITNIAVHPEYRGIHIGDKILKALIDTSQNMGIYAMTLEVRKTNIAAQNLYKKYGFEVAGVRPKYYADNNEDAIIMWKNGIKID